MAPTVDAEPKKEEAMPAGESAGDEPVRLEVPTAQILSQPINIFASRPQSSAKANIFANSKSVNLFALTANPQSALNIFTQVAQQPPLLPNDEDSLSDASQDHPAEKPDPEPTVREMKYEYEGGMERLGEFKLSKFRNGCSPAKEGVLVSVERDSKSESKNILYFLVRSEGSRIALYHAFLPKGAVAANFMGRKENVKLEVVKAKKEEEAVATQREVVKMQFENEQDADRFQQVLKEYFSSD